MLGIHQYFWRLIPANPILLRVVESGGKRTRDLIIRCGYLGLLIGWVIFLLLTSGSTVGGGDLSALAKTSAAIFQSMSYVQLALVALLAPIFTAGAITQEKDSQTYDILLSTPLTNGQIVLGSLLSRLFFVVSLLISGIPIFSITQIFGGVAIKSIALSFGIAAATAFVTGAVAMAIATFKVGTRRTIFSFYLFIVVYMVGGIVLDRFPAFHLAGRTVQQGVESHISWFTGINPFLALKVIFNDPTYAPPLFEELPAGLQRWPIGWYLSSPTAFYISFMFFISFLMVMPSILLLRRMAQSTASLKTLVLQKLKITSGDRRRKPRPVWTNPIAWREARTKASAARATLLRYGFIAAGLMGALFLVFRFGAAQPPSADAVILSPGSYDPVANTLTLAGSTYRLAPGAAVEVEMPTVDPTDPFARSNKRTIPLASIVEPMVVAGPPELLASLGEAGAGSVRRAADGSVLPGKLLLKPMERTMPQDLARQYLLGLCVVELAVILLIVTNAAASTVTREKEDGTLDLLLSSPITSRYYIWGKLRGLVSFVLPLVAVPVISVLFFVVCDLVRRSGSWDNPLFEWTVFPESLLLLPGMLVIVSAFAAILGMQMSLRCRTTVMAVMTSIGVVVGVCFAMGWCGYSLLNSNSTGGNPLAIMVGSFSPFTLMQMLIAPSTTGFNYTLLTEDDFTGRGYMLVFTLAAVAIYTAVVWSMYSSMVKNFDMTIRKQSR